MEATPTNESNPAESPKSPHFWSKTERSSLGSDSDDFMSLTYAQHTTKMKSILL